MMNIKAVLNPTLSTKFPYRGGIIAPPTIAVHKRPEPLGLSSPIPSMASVNIVGNIIELKSQTARILHMLTMPVVLIETIMRAIAIVAKIPSTLPGFIIFVRYEPINLPTMAPDQ